MTMSVVILRPRDSADETAKRAHELDISTVVDPLFVVEPIAWAAPPPSEYDAVMLTSSNALKHAGPELQKYSQLPVVAVGETTAVAAQEAGFNVAVIGDRGAKELLQSLPNGQFPRILRLTGKDHVKLASSYRQITICRVYEARALPLGEKAQVALRQGNIVLLYSIRAASILAGEMDRLNIDRSINPVAALSANIAQAAGNGWKNVDAAVQPTDDALLSLAGRLCHAPGSS